MSTSSVDLRKFLKKAFVLVCPFLVFFLPSSWILYRSGELTSIEDAIKIQNTQQQLSIYGLAYTQNIENFKLHSVLDRNPEILILGTSRVLSIRTAFFNSKFNSYNAGKGISTLKEINAFLQRIPISRTPKVVIIGLDQYFFNEYWVRKNQRDTNHLFDSNKAWYEIVAQGPTHAKVYHDFFANKFDLLDVSKREGIGLLAKATGHGYLNNGDMIGMGKDSKDEKFADTFKRIREGNSRFEYADSLYERSLQELKDIIVLCKQRGIHVVSFLPPFAQAVYNEMCRRNSQYAYIWKIEPQIRPLIETYQFSFYNFTDLHELSGDRPEYYDGFHASEKAYLRLFIKMAEQDSILATYTNINELRHRLEMASSDLFVFSAEESLRENTVGGN